jgi:hypothetical protein
MSTFFNDMQAALDTHLSTLSGGYDIAWPNITYEPVGNATYLRANFIPAETQQVSLGANGKDETLAIYQIDVVSPRGAGRSTLTDSVADHFKRGTVLTYNNLKLRVRSVSIAPAIQDGAWFFVPLSVSTQTYTGARL